jgi:hypothetical protein
MDDLDGRPGWTTWMDDLPEPLPLLDVLDLLALDPLAHRAGFPENAARTDRRFLRHARACRD